MTRSTGARSARYENVTQLSKPRAVRSAKGSDRPPVKRTRRNGEEAQDAIIAAAAHQFATRGLSGTRIMDIAEAAQVSTATFYSYFRSKEEVFVCASLEPFLVFAKEIVEQLDQTTLQASNDLELNELYMTSLYTHLKRHSDAVRAVLLASRDPRATDAAKQARRVFARVIRDLEGLGTRWAQARGIEVPDAGRRVRAILSLAVVTVLMGDWFYGGTGKALEAEALATIKDLTYRAYCEKLTD